jgi:hypothetical protein
MPAFAGLTRQVTGLTRPVAAAPHARGRTGRALVRRFAATASTATTAVKGYLTRRICRIWWIRLTSPAPQSHPCPTLATDEHPGEALEEEVKYSDTRKADEEVHLVVRPQTFHTDESSHVLCESATVGRL